MMRFAMMRSNSTLVIPARLIGDFKSCQWQRPNFIDVIKKKDTYGVG
jgi:hypothetical protein